MKYCVTVCKGPPDKIQSLCNVLKSESVDILPTQAKPHVSGICLWFLLANM